MPELRPDPPRSHRTWIPISLILMGWAATYYVNHRDDLDRNFRGWITLVIPILISPLLLIWFLFLSRFRWSTRIFGFLVLVGLGVLTRYSVRLNSAVDGRGLPELSWRWSPTKDEVLRQRLAEHPEVHSPGAAATSSAIDFPQFLGPKRLNVVEGANLDPNWSANPPKLIWRQPIGLGWGSFAVSQGRAITQEQRGNDEIVTCYEIRSGTLLWAHTNQTRFSEFQGGDGPRATPTVIDQQVYSYGATGLLDCLDLNSGSSIWTRSVLKEPNKDNLTWGKSCSPLVYDDLVVVTGGRNGGPTVLAYRRNSGEPVWSAGVDEPSYASPVLAMVQGQRQVLSLNAVNLMALEPASGKVLWQYAWAPKSKWPRISQPVQLGADRVFLSAGYGLGSTVISLHLEPGGQWTVQEEWSAKTMKTQFNNVSVRDGVVYGLDDGFLACVDLASGTRKWRDGRYGSGQSLLVDRFILVQTEPGPVALVEAKPTGWNELARLDALSGKTWNNPVVASPYLLVRNDQEAACYRLPLLKDNRTTAQIR